MEAKVPGPGGSMTSCHEPGRGKEQMLAPVPPSLSSRVQGECVAVAMVCERTENNGEFSVTCKWVPVAPGLTGRDFSAEALPTLVSMCPNPKARASQPWGNSRAASWALSLVLPKRQSTPEAAHDTLIPTCRTTVSRASAGHPNSHSFQA